MRLALSTGGYGPWHEWTGHPFTIAHTARPRFAYTPPPPTDTPANTARPSHVQRPRAGRGAHARSARRCMLICTRICMHASGLPTEQAELCNGGAFKAASPIYILRLEALLQQLEGLHATQGSGEAS